MSGKECSSHATHYRLLTILKNKYIYLFFVFSLGERSRRFGENHRERRRQGRDHGTSRVRSETLDFETRRSGKSSKRSSSQLRYSSDSKTSSSSEQVATGESGHRIDPQPGTMPGKPRSVERTRSNTSFSQTFDESIPGYTKSE